VREIRFRAWNKENNQMELVDFLGENTLHIKNSEWENREDFELMQYTGLKDKNDKEIYEGDIVKYTDGELIRRTGQITFDCYGFMMEEILKPNSREMPQIDFLGNIDDFEEFVFEVIGNIYQNPEILENNL
jgi:uncharacterized phage protein (TIGR01671 family)